MKRNHSIVSYYQQRKWSKEQHSGGKQVTSRNLTESHVYEDNQSVFISSTNTSTSLNHKNVALSYHFVRENQANEVVDVRKIKSKENYADPFTKGLNSREHGDHFYELMTN